MLRFLQSFSWLVWRLRLSRWSASTCSDPKLLLFPKHPWVEEINPQNTSVGRCDALWIKVPHKWSHLPASFGKMLEIQLGSQCVTSGLSPFRINFKNVLTCQIFIILLPLFVRVQKCRSTEAPEWSFSLYFFILSQIKFCCSSHSFGRMFLNTLKQSVSLGLVCYDFWYHFNVLTEFVWIKINGETSTHRNVFCWVFWSWLKILKMWFLMHNEPNLWVLALCPLILLALLKRNCWCTFGL